MTSPERNDFKKVDLFGGAITVELPADFFDVSDIRQVPDHQEVYLDRDGLTSISIDILEYVQQADVPLGALQVHLEDINEVLTRDAIRTSMLHVEVPKLSYYSSAVWAHVDENWRDPSLRPKDDPNDPKTSNILVLLIRLEKYQTDILVSVNFKGTGEEHDSYWVDAKTYFDKIIDTFEIKHYSLFSA